MTEADQGPDRRFSHYALISDTRLVAIVLVSAVGVLGPTVASPALPQIAEDLAVPDARIGLVISAFFLPAIVAIPTAGILADIYGRRRLVLSGLTVFGVAGTAIAFVDSFAVLLVLRGVQGVGFAALSPLSIAVIGDLYTGAEGSTAQGVRSSANSFAGLAAPAAAGFLAGIAWHRPFLLYAAAAPVAVLVFVYFPETGRINRKREHVVPELGEYLLTITGDIADRHLAVLVFGGFAVFFLRYTLLTFVPLFAVQVIDTSVLVAGLFISLLGAVRLVASPLAGAAVAWTSRKVAFVGTLVIAGTGGALIPATTAPLWLGVVVAAYSVGEALAVPILNDFVAATAAAERRAGIVSGLNMMKSTANVIAPVLAGVVLATLGFGAVFWLGAGVVSVYALVAAVLLNTAAAG